MHLLVIRCKYLQNARHAQIQGTTFSYSPTYLCLPNQNLQVFQSKSYRHFSPARACSRVTRFTKHRVIQFSESRCCFLHLDPYSSLGMLSSNTIGLRSSNNNGCTKIVSVVVWLQRTDPRHLGTKCRNISSADGRIKQKKLILTLYVLCIVTNSIYKPTSCTFCMYLFYNLFATLHASNDYFLTALSYGWLQP